MVIAVESAHKVNKEKVIALIGMTQGLSAALGPSVGGVTTEFFGWQWVFFINIPIIFLSLLLCVKNLKLNGEKINDKGIDLLGSLISILFLGSLTLSLIKGREWGWQSKEIVLLLVFSGLTLVLFLISQYKNKNPMLPLILFKNRQFNAASITMILSNIFLVGVTVTLPSYLTILHAKSEMKAALMITPISGMIFIISPLSSLIMKKIENKYITMLGFLMILLAYIMFVKMNVYEYFVYLISGCIILGIGYGIIIGPLTVIAASNFTGKLLSASQSVIGVFRQLGIILAVAIYISSLTSYIGVSKANIKSEAKHLINTLNISTKDKNLYYKKVSENMNHISKRNSNQQLINKKEQEALIKRKSNEFKNKDVNLSEDQKRFILEKIKEQIEEKSNSINEKSKLVNIEIIRASNREMNNAYIKLLSRAIPFIIISIFIGLLFEKTDKRKKGIL